MHKKQGDRLADPATRVYLNVWGVAELSEPARASKEIGKLLARWEPDRASRSKAERYYE
jgi:uncharacterized small protein (DUF1192 family)